MAAISFGYLGKPYSVVAVTTNYTVPTGYFAVVSANCKKGATVSVDGTAVLRSAQWSVMVSLNSPKTAITTDAPQPSITTRENQLDSGFSVVGDTFSNDTATTSPAMQYIVPEGTVIAVSSAADTGCLVQLYSAAA